MKKMNPVRVRIAPSPTGNLHIGTARSALFNYLYAKKRKGKFILRIEDTDLERSDRKFESDILSGLKWLGLLWDEGPDGNKYIGKYEPYRQSERVKYYRKYIKQLLDKGYAYHCFCTKEELEIERDKAQKEGKAPIYSGKCRKLTKNKVDKKIKAGEKSIIRYKVPHKKIEFNDLVRGRLEFDTSLLGDIAIAKDINTPLYNLAVVIDDLTMKITHVIRGEDHISNTPKQILLYDALKECHPIYTHLPLILGPDKSKLSKRHGATSVIEYRKLGYLPEAMINFMALMGWNPKDNREYFTLKDLELEFNLENVNKSGAIFNIEKLDSINGYYIKKLKEDSYIKLALEYLVDEEYLNFENKKYIYNETGREVSTDIIKKALLLEKDRIKKFSELKDPIKCILGDKLEYDKDLLRWKDMTDKQIQDNLNSSVDLLNEISNEKFNLENLEKTIFGYIKKQGIGNGEFLWPMRVALSGKKQSPPPFELADTLGKIESIKRIESALLMLR